MQECEGLSTGWVAKVLSFHHWVSRIHLRLSDLMAGDFTSDRLSQLVGTKGMSSEEDKRTQTEPTMTGGP